MGFFKTGERPFFDDLDTGRKGTLIGMTEHTDGDFVIITFQPLNTLFPWQRETYKRPIPSSALHKIFHTSNEPGVETEVLYICDGDQGDVAKIIKRKDQEELERLRSKNQSLRMQQAITAQERDDSVKGAASFQAKVKEATKNKEEEEKPPWRMGPGLGEW